MTEAIVIPFPRPASAPVCQQERLRLALEDLQSALAEQKQALGNWRFAMTELGIGVAGLGHALGGYQGSLAAVETRLGGLRAETVKLQTWAGSALSAEIPALTDAASRVGG